MLGLGSRSTLFYIEQLNVQYFALFGGYSTCPFILLNTNFDTINSFLPNNFKQLESELSFYLEKLKKLQISNLIIPNITLHETWDRMNIEFSIEHPVVKTLELLKKKNISEIVLFGSKYAMEASYLKTIFKSNNIEAIQPEENDKLFLDSLRKLIYNNEETSQDVEKYNMLLCSYSKNNTVIIACTELSIPLNSYTNIYDMAQIQIQSAIQKLIK